MKYLEQYQLVTLEDNKKYAVIKSIIYEDKNFAFLVNAEDPKDQLIAIVSKENDEIKINTLDNKAEENIDLINTLSDKFINGILKDYNMEDLVNNG